MTSLSVSHKPGFARPSALISLFITVLCCAAPLAAQGHGITLFDAPDAGHGLEQGTLAICINQGGTVAGYYIDSNRKEHGFVRAANAAITEFDVPNLHGPLVTAINASGEVVGYGTRVSGGDGTNHGFLRRNTTYIAINVPGSADTVVTGINDSDEMAGSFDDAAGIWHGFIREASGTYTTFDEPDATLSQLGLGTRVLGINAGGDVTGYYNDNNTGQAHAFIRDQFGNFTSFDPPGADGTVANSINLSAEVAGNYTDIDQVLHGFVRDAAGNITSFDPLGSFGTFAYSINDAGTVVGQWDNTALSYRGYERNPSGGISSLSVAAPDSLLVAAINNGGHIAGFYIDSKQVWHGFVR